MGKTRDHFKKIRDTKGKFHAKIGTINDRNGMDLTELEDTKKRKQEYRVQFSCSSRVRLCDPIDGSPSPPLALLIVMLPTAHLTSHSRMCGSR